MGNGVEKLGIPAGRLELMQGRQYEVCPRCHIWVLLEKRKDFESFSGVEYARHWREQHPEYWTEEDD